MRAHLSHQVLNCIFLAILSRLQTKSMKQNWRKRRDCRFYKNLHFQWNCRLI